MPGFSDRGVTGRKKAYYDGIKLAEQQSGKQFEDTEEQRVRRRTINGASMYKTSAAVPDSLVQFANEIHEVERITPKEEVVLGEKTQEAIRLQNIYDGLEAKLDRVPTDEEWCAAAGKINMNALSQAIEEGLEAKNTLVTANLRMVQGVVNVYIRNGLRGQYNAGDLMQDGIMVSYFFGSSLVLWFQKYSMISFEIGSYPSGRKIRSGTWIPVLDLCHVLDSIIYQTRTSRAVKSCSSPSAALREPQTHPKSSVTNGE
jgi:hypothetical protein